MNLSTNETILKPEMFWIDLETTGLDARSDVPLEIGVILTDRHLNEIDSWKALIWEDNDVYLMAIANAIPFVRDMHTKNGLWKDLEVGSTPPMSRSRADASLCSWLAQSGVESGTLSMAGSSIGSLDRPFVLEHFPILNKFLHYRNIDISSIKELCRLWRPDLLQAHEAEQPSDAKWHRVLEDAQGSIDEYKFYIQSGFIQIPNEEFVRIR